MRPITTAVVVAANNEADALPELVVRLLGCDHHGIAVGLFIVDDGSTDGTWDAARAASGLNLTAIGLDRNYGKTAALRVGLQAAIAQSPEVIVFMDADGEHPAEDLAHFVAEAVRCDSIIVGRRKDYRRGLVGRLLSALVALVAKLLGVPYRASDSEYVALPCGIARELLSKSDFGSVPLLQALGQVASPSTMRRIDFSVASPFTQGRASRWSRSLLAEKAIELLLWDVFEALRRIAFATSVLITAVAVYAIRIGLDEPSRQSGVGSIIFVQAIVGFIIFLMLTFISAIVSAQLALSRKSFRQFAPVALRRMDNASWETHDCL